MAFLRPASILLATNPFEPVFHALQAFALGARRCPVEAPEERVPAEQLLPHVAQLVDELALAADRIRAGAAVTDEEADVHEGAALFALYSRYGPDLQAIIDADGVDAPFYGRFAEDHRRLFDHPRANVPDALQLFGRFYQARRAFHFISTTVRGDARCVAAVRADLWRAALGSDPQAYTGGGDRRTDGIPVLITGETGTGKEGAARCIGWSRYLPFDPASRRFAARYGADFHVRNVCEGPRELVESALFGHKKGSFTGAAADAAGCLGLPKAYGTLFLDEIGELPEHIQVKLLRPLESREYVPVGETTPWKIQGLHLFATHRDLAAMCREGTFRPDLYERLNGMRVHLPPLRQILAESPRALEDYVRGMVAAMVADPAEVEVWTARVVRSIEEGAPHYLWPRNFRQLKNYTGRFILTGGNTPLPGASEEEASAPVVAAAARDGEQEESGPPSSGILGTVAKAGRLTLEEVQRAYVTQVYALTGENKAETGRRTGLDWRKVERFIDWERLERLRPRRG